MEIPGSNDIRIKNKLDQEKVKQSSKSDAQKTSGDGSSASKSSGATSGTEQINLSSKGKDVQKAHEVVNSSPDIRAEKADQIKRLKFEIEKGLYQRDSQQIAEKILRDLISESTFLQK
ncbi:MAG: flagellar biosynthesis anti-sigma factor FlgM [Nitrospinales bacterium]